MRSTVRSNACLVAVGGLVLSGALAPWACERPRGTPATAPTTKPAVRCFTTSWWKENGRELEREGWKEQSRLLLRSNTEQGADLLLRALTSTEALAWDRKRLPSVAEADRNLVVFRYTAGAHRLEMLPLDAWETAAGEICDCVDQHLSAACKPFTFADGGMKFEGRLVRTAGPHFFGATASPSGRYVAVVSAGGEVREHGGMPFIGGGRTATGTYYQQVFRKSDGQPAAETVRLPFTEHSDWTRPCWSSDERFLVYPDLHSGFTVWIAETKLREEDRHE